MEDRLRVLNQFFLFRIHTQRFAAGGLVVLAAIAVVGWYWQPFLWAYAVAEPLAAVRLYDMLQTKNTITPNFPVLGHFRYWSLSLSPEIHQYFVENDTDGTPFNKTDREFVSKRADKLPDTYPFGMQLNVYASQYEWAPHSIYPKESKAPVAIEYSDSVGMPLDDALVFAHDTLNGYGLRRELSLIVAGKFITGFDIMKRIDPHPTKSFEELYPSVYYGAYSAPGA